jgi:histidinol phosphatase-like enzyme
MPVTQRLSDFRRFVEVVDPVSDLHHRNNVRMGAGLPLRGGEGGETQEAGEKKMHTLS